jgi:WD40 repeat protein/serine/threonine protein kinase
MLDSGSAPMVGQIVPDYELLRCIGRGAYGEVWLARSNATGVLRAAKIVWRHKFEHDRPFQREFEGIQRFERISREHPSQLALFHIGRNEAEDYFYYVMELADDVQQLSDAASYSPRTLRADLSHGRLPAAQVLEIGLALTEALGHLHRHGLVHRDVKPSNVIFVDGRPKLADIGLVTDASDRCSIVGTEGYLPPEGPGTPQADIFALGKVLYEAATGLDRREFPKLPDNLRSWPEAKHVFELNEIILKACAASGKERYQNEAELNADLALLRANQSVREKHLLQRRLRHMRQAGAGLIALMVLGAVPYYIAIKAARVARHEAANARLAKADAEDKLWNSYLQQAKASRMSGRLGRKSEALAALKRAAEIRPDPRLRNEAIACLALTELRVAKEWDTGIDSESVGCFDRDYNRFAIAPRSNNWISIRRVTDGAELMRLSGFTPPFGGVFRFSPDGRWLAVQHDHEREFVIWDLARNQPAAQFHHRNCRTLDFSADGRLAAICFHHGPDTNNPITIYDLGLGQTKRILQPPSLPESLRFRPSQNQLAASFEESNDALIWDLESGAVVERLHHPNGQGQLAWNPAGDLLATVCGDCQVYIWDVPNTNIVHVLAGHSGIPREVSFSFDGQFLASRGWDGTLRFWDPWSGQQLFKQLVAGFTDGFSGAGYRYGYNINIHRKGIFELAPSQECRLLRPGSSIGPKGDTCHFSQDGKLLLTAHEDGARLWNPATGKVVAFIPEPQSYGALFDAGDDRVLLASEQGIKVCAFHRGAAGEISLGQRSKMISNLPAQNLVYAQSMKVFGFSVADKIYLLNRETGATAVLPSAGGASGYVDPRLGLSLHPDGRLLVCGQTDPQTQLYSVRVLDTVTGQLIRELPHDGRAGSQTLFSPNGKWLLTGDNLEYRLWEVGSWRLVYTISRGDTGYAAFMAFSPDSSILALTPSRDTVRLVEAASGRELATLDAPEANDIYYLSFSPDRAQLAVVYRYGPIQIWDLRLLRSELAAMNLDWISPPQSGESPPSGATPPP